MRQIKRDAPPPLPRFPQNVVEAIAIVAKAQEAGEEVAEEIRVPVGAVDVVVHPGPDERFGTPDDQVDIVSPGAHPEVEPENDQDDNPEVVEPEVEHGHGHNSHEDKPEVPGHDEDPEPEDPEPEVVEPEVAKYDLTMKKSELLDLADGIKGVDKTKTKAEIIEALDAFYAGK